jgi:hypothetical protein
MTREPTSDPDESPDDDSEAVPSCKCGTDRLSKFSVVDREYTFLGTLYLPLGRHVGAIAGLVSLRKVRAEVRVDHDPANMPRLYDLDDAARSASGEALRFLGGLDPFEAVAGVASWPRAPAHIVRRGAKASGGEVLDARPRPACRTVTQVA